VSRSRRPHPRTGCGLEWEHRKRIPLGLQSSKDAVCASGVLSLSGADHRGTNCFSLWGHVRVGPGASFVQIGSVVRGNLFGGESLVKIAKALTRWGIPGMLLLLVSVPVMADLELNLRPGVTETSERVYDLHMLVMWICVAIGVVVYGVLAYSILRHRKSRGVKPATFHESTKVEVVWTIIPILILVGIAIPATKALIALEDTGDYDMSIKVTGYQWKWHYTYLDNDIDFYSSLAGPSRDAAILDSGVDPDSVPHYLLDVDHPLVIPVNKRIRFLITADDVIHSWWVPDLGWKQDAIPGYVNTAWTEVSEPGVYRGQCAELCGRGHGFMPIVVEAKTQAEFDQWVADQKKAPQSDAAVNNTGDIVQPAVAKAAR